MNGKYMFIGLVYVVLCFEAHSQTTLSGDHVITGNVDVGTTGTAGNLQVTGQTGNLASPGIKVTGDGGVLFEGTLGTGQLPATGTGTRFMWYPKKAALRAGTVTGSAWGDFNIGIRSVAFSDSVASGNFSIAMSGGEAMGHSSTAMGFAWSWGDFSTAMSGGESHGSTSTAMSGGGAYGATSTAMSFGYSWGDLSTAMSFGQAHGNFSVAAGDVMAGAYRSVVVGSYNSLSGNESASSWVETDPIFVVGNGTGDQNDAPEVMNRNALTVYKNGKIKMDRQGDILMGEFGNPE